MSLRFHGVATRLAMIAATSVLVCASLAHASSTGSTVAGSSAHSTTAGGG